MDKRAPRDFGNGMVEDLSRSIKVAYDLSGNPIVKIIPILKDGKTGDYILDPDDEAGEEKFMKLREEDRHIGEVKEIQ